jgi:hypothetical protein
MVTDVARAPYGLPPVCAIMIALVFGPIAAATGSTVV